MATDVLSRVVPRESSVSGELQALVDLGWRRIEAVFERLSDPLPDMVDEGGWDVRHVLSHLIGGWQRVPIHACFFLTGALGSPVPVQRHHSYWIPEWDTAPVAAFRVTMEIAVEGNKQFLQCLEPEILARSRPTPLGDMTLHEFLLTNYDRHLIGMHLPQLEAFAR